MRRFLVTGGAGFIGSHMVDRLLQQADASVTVIDNFDAYYQPALKRANIHSHLGNPRYRLIELDIRDWNSLTNLLSEQSFDAIVHLAARAGVRPSLEQPRLYEQVNVAGTLNMLELARAKKVPRFIFGSSSSVYGPEAVPPFREDAPLDPISPYAATKAAGELLAHTYSHLYDIQVVALRFFTVYGARQRPDLAIHKFTRLITENLPIPVFGDGRSERDYTFVDDIVEGILAAMDYDASRFEIINLGESQTVSLLKLIALLEEALGKRAVIDWLPAQPGDLPRTLADISKAQRLLGYSPTTPIEVGIPRFVEWFQQIRSLKTR